MNFSKYPNYKKTKISWIAEIPTNWTLKKIKYTLRENASTKNSQLQAGAISFGEVVTKDDDSIPVETKNSYQEVLAGEFLINPINLNYDLKSLRTALSKINVCVSPAYIVAKLIDGECDKNFLKYLLYVFDVSHMKTLGAGVRQTITFKDIGDCYWPLPSLNEQSKIATFLDIKVKKIDELIKEQDKLILLLMEKRASIISDALLGGINQAAPKISTDIEWLGEIPAHWILQRLKYSFDLNPSISEIENIAPDELVPFFPMESIGEDGRLSLDYERPYEDVARAYTYFRNGDVIIAKVTPCFENGKGALIQGLKSGFGFGTTELAVLRPKENLDSKYLYYISISQEIRSGGVAYMTGAGGLKRVPDIFYGNLDWPLPPLSEQIQIVNYLDAELGKNEQLRVKAAELIELLKEYRCSLISEAVIGGIRVDA
jgi:type I restriction enzyme S subunit